MKNTSQNVWCNPAIILEVCNIVDLSYGVCQRFLSGEFTTRRISAKFVHRLLSIEKNGPVFMCANKIIPSNESWVYGYDTQTRIAVIIRHRHHDRRKHRKFLWSGGTVNRWFYCDVLNASGLLSDVIIRGSYTRTMQSLVLYSFYPQRRRQYLSLPTLQILEYSCGRRW